MTVGMLVPDIENPLFPPIVRGLEDELARSGYTVILANTDNDAEHEEAVTHSLLARQIDGLVIASAILGHEGMHWLDDQSIPLVFVNRMETDHDVPWVIPDDVAGAGAMMDHLFELGHTDVAMVSGPKRLSTSRFRFEGYKRALRRHEQKLDRSRLIFSDAVTVAAGAKACEELVASRSSFSAIFAGNDLIAIGCMETMRESGIDVPGQVSIAGYNDLLLVDKMNPPLTTVRVPKYEMGAAAARLLLKAMSDEGFGEDAVKQLKLTPELVVRQSTGPPP